VLGLEKALSSGQFDGLEVDDVLGMLAGAAR
jgi:hypothetical protein